MARLEVSPSSLQRDYLSNAVTAYNAINPSGKYWINDRDGMVVYKNSDQGPLLFKYGAPDPVQCSKQ